MITSILKNLSFLSKVWLLSDLLNDNTYFKEMLISYDSKCSKYKENEDKLIWQME